MILLPPPVQCIRWYARTRTPTDACSISAVAAMPIWSDLSLLILNRYSTSFGVSLIDRNLHGSTSGASAISSCGIIAAPCTGAMRSTRIRAASCTAPKSRASNDQRKRGAEGCMKRRDVITLIGGARMGPLAAPAQQAAMRVVGFLYPTSPDTISDRVRGFRQGLKDVGFAEGENVAIEYRSADGQFDRLPALAAELVRRQVALIAAGNLASA